MEPIKKNPEDEDDGKNMLTPSVAPTEDGLSKKRKVQVVIAALAVFLLIAGILFLMGGRKAGKDAKAVPQANRGLMQAETMRRQKDLFDDKSKQTDPSEEWVRKYKALREAQKEPGPSDSMPDPVPLYPNGIKPESDEPLTAKPEGPQGSLKSPWKSSMGGFGKTIAAAPQGMAEPPKPVEFKPSDQMAKEMTDTYQKALAYNASEQLVYTRNRMDEESKGKETAPKGEVMKTASSGKVVVSAGQEMTAVLNESLNSDYPSVAKATLTSPAELAGSTVLLSYSLGQERVTAQVLKLILPAKEGERAKEQTLSAVVKSGLPGLTGDVSHHWIPQIASGIANAGLTAGALYYASQNSSKDLGTAVLVAPMIEQSVQGVLKPINYLGRDRPVTVSVPAGTEFTLLVTDGFEVYL